MSSTICAIDAAYSSSSSTQFAGNGTKSPVSYASLEADSYADGTAACATRSVRYFASTWRMTCPARASLSRRSRGTRMRPNTAYTTNPGHGMRKISSSHVRAAAAVRRCGIYTSITSLTAHSLM